MKKLDYRKPKTVDEAVRTLKDCSSSDASARLLAGGTDLMGVINLRISPVPAGTVVSIADLGMSGIEPEDGGVTIGAATALSDIAASEEIKRRLPLVAQAARSVASPQIRHVATIGGNICQEPRCWYYRYPDNRFHCMRKGGDLCNAMTGSNAYHSVLGAAKVRLSPCSVGCPNGTDIPAYFDAVRRGDMTEAAKIFMRVNPLGAATGRVCPHDCQSSCNRNEFDEAVGIRNIERVVGDYAREHFDEVTGSDFAVAASGKSVGIIGAGPAGLTAAWYLRRQGHTVTVYDRNDEIGGMLRYAIPAYRMPSSVMDGIREMYDRIGVSFVLGPDGPPHGPSGTDGHDAILIACGAWAASEAPFDGSEHAIPGLSFLYDLRAGERGGVAGDGSDGSGDTGNATTRVKPGDKVAVIGGGNVAVDAAVSARRLGCDVSILYRRSREEMPAYDDEIEDALAEGVKLVTNVAPIKITTGDAGVQSIIVAACRSDVCAGDKGEARGRSAALRVDENDTTEISADVVITAVGQRTETESFTAYVTPDRRGRIAAHDGTGQTEASGVFAAGDVVTGPATVVEAIAGGRRAAEGIHAFLTGEALAATTAATAAATTQTTPTTTETSESDPGFGEALSFDPSCIEISASVSPETTAPEDRTLRSEDTASLTEADARTEAMRCFNCGCVAVTPSDIAPALVALDAEIITTERRMPAADFFRAGAETQTSLSHGEIVTRIFVPYPPEGTVQEYRKFRTRKAIDFPVASVASVISEEDGAIASARIVLGGAAPVPYRAEAAENAVVGNPTTDDTASAAARLAVKDMHALAENAYKIRVFEALVRRAVAGVRSGDPDTDAR
jgi:NADPH-dependent glutamate synthase beta subunit-like oxidoreductase/CO/xanthine dehydrogenase FAD-binding subunit